MSAPSPTAALQRLDPIAAQDRIALLDVLRGFALYGVLLANTAAWFSGRAFLAKEAFTARSTWLDELAGFLIRIFVDGKAMTLFYGWGLGLIGHVGTALCIPLTLAIFALQILVSRVWLRRFRFGPVEWALRSLGYGERQPMRRPESP